ncbi:uncharacterized protein NEMAJ01_0008 [Nematocida major]|nr:uncharacterized protein NEMAJ01_0008 [Nematocida major]KAH9385112.1 hypothetical protein NEMAJ01_0008 [Nematocida major]
MSLLIKPLFQNAAKLGNNSKAIDAYVKKYVETAKIVEEVLHEALSKRNP